MSLALANPRIMKANQSDLAIVVFYCLILTSLPPLKASEEGDPCTLKGNLPGVCKATSKCEPHLEKYFKTGTLIGDDVPTCGLGTYEEIVCCPIAECCQDE